MCFPQHMDRPVKWYLVGFLSGIFLLNQGQCVCRCVCLCVCMWTYIVHTCTYYIYIFSVLCEFIGVSQVDQMAIWRQGRGFWMQPCWSRSEQLLLSRQLSASLQVPCAEAISMQSLGGNTATSLLNLRKCTELVGLIVTWPWKMWPTSTFSVQIFPFKWKCEVCGILVPTKFPCISSPFNKMRDH